MRPTASLSVIEGRPFYRAAFFELYDLRVNFPTD